MKIDMHVHTTYSLDSSMEPKKLLDIAAERGLGGVAVVDHNTLRGGLEAVDAAPPDMIVIPGMEVTTALGHVLGLFLETPIESRDPARVQEEIHAQGGIAVLPHPLGCLDRWPEELLSGFDAFEGYNARRSTLRKPSPEHGEAVLREFADTHDAAVLGSSDAHFYREIGRAYTEISAGSTEDVKSEILARRTSVAGTHTTWVYRFASFTRKLVTSAGT